ncbi:hypothetical protein [Bifidobacterium tibiigranuli]|jgi:hypothetical protein|uniref:hypothetical protein n=1 Tax=Bifidobacterium tibiigranuli TaxID=2172043 RepID=UPI0026F241F7|nr:hypothetical protein [Bifidobacterium tibiigranuli]MCI1649568.1 hypothetical protein [Bifidobacterium tibiigranuli]MCI2186733.1 hypothetical protein [Bifidobacterium tibiigranuli]MCI2204514.1 hypothetical protein [Bifidobacterium tibiigranuli]
MSESMGHRHIRITRSTGLGVTRTEVEITEVTAGISGAITEESAAAIPGTQALASQLRSQAYDYDYAHQHLHDGLHDGEECFDPSCCDAREKALIRSLRAYLRPQIAPDCLIARLSQTLDRYCEVNHLTDGRGDAQ